MTDERDVEFTTFVVAARPKLARIAYLMCGDWHRAEDIVQVVLVRVYPRWAQVCRDGDPHAYVRRALINALTDERRRPWRRECPVEVITDEHYDTSAFLKLDVNKSAAVWGALNRLPLRQRAVVVLRYVEDLSVEQVAKELGISEGTVKSQAARGLTAMRIVLLPAPSGMVSERNAHE